MTMNFVAEIGCDRCEAWVRIDVERRSKRSIYGLARERGWTIASAFLGRPTNDLCPECSRKAGELK